jgi:hypothetical protein
MVFGIIGVVEVDMISEEFSAHSMMSKLIVHQCLPKRYDQMRTDGGDGE